MAYETQNPELSKLLVAFENAVDAYFDRVTKLSFSAAVLDVIAEQMPNQLAAAMALRAENDARKAAEAGKA